MRRCRFFLRNHYRARDSLSRSRSAHCRLSPSLPSLPFSRSLCARTSRPLAILLLPLCIRLSSLSRELRERLVPSFRSWRDSLSPSASPLRPLFLLGSPPRVGGSSPPFGERNQSPCTKRCATPRVMRKLENAPETRVTRALSGRRAASHTTAASNCATLGYAPSSGSHRWRVSWVRAIGPFPFLHPDGPVLLFVLPRRRLTPAATAVIHVAVSVVVS